MLKHFQKIVFGTSRLMNLISGVALAAMMLLTFFNVLARLVWRPFIGTYEITSFLASVAISFALAYCAVQKGHVAVTLFAERLSDRVQNYLDVIVSVIGTVLFTVLAWQVYKYAWVIYRSGEVSLTIQLPFYPFIFGVALSLLMLALVNLNDFFQTLKKVLSR